MSRAGRKPIRFPQKRRESPCLDAWRRSPRLKAVALNALDIARAVLAAKPKCGAKRKRDGQPCQQPGLENGRCKFHGGKTPSGAGWHRIRVPAKGEVRGVEKFEAKLAAKAKRDATQPLRLRMMSPEQRERHERWQASHAPGPKSKRAARRQNLEARKMIETLSARAEARRAAEEQREREIREEIRRDRDRLIDRSPTGPRPAAPADQAKKPATDIFE